MVSVSPDRRFPACRTCGVTAREYSILDGFCSYDKFMEIRYFQIMGMEVPVKDEAISEALYRLPEKKRKIILMSYFLDMTEKEIAECMNLVQSTVHYHKADSLRLLKKLLE